MLFIGCIQSCSTEESLPENDSPIKTVTKEEALLFLKQNPINTSTKFFKKESFTINFNAIIQEKITNSDQLITIIPIENKEKKEYERILFLKIKDTIKSAVFSMYPDDNSSSKNFSGKIKITSLNGQFINGFRIKNGHFISRFLKKESTNYKNNEFSKLIVIDGVEFEELNEVTIINNYHSTPSTIYYMTLFEEWSNYGGNNNDYGMGWNYGGGSGDSTNDSSTEEIARKIVDSIDDSQLDPCTKAIMEKLKNSNEKDIASIFKKFGATTIYKLTMMMGTMQKVDSFAETIKTSTNNYLITVSKDNYTTASNLYRATALLHETIHAYMLSIVDDSNYPTTTTPQLTNFPELFKAFVNKRNNTQTAVMAQHEDMAKIYVEAIATALEQFQWNETGGIPSTIADKQIFLDMAWSGLHKTAVFDKTYPIGNPNRDRILARILAEQNGVYSQGQYAIGKKCN